MKDSPPEYSEYAKYRTPNMATDIETRIPVMEERLEVSKKMSTTEATIVKEPVTETKTVEVPVTHEELRVERRPASKSSMKGAAEKPVQSRTEIKVPLTKERCRLKRSPMSKRS